MRGLAQFLQVYLPETNIFFSFLKVLWHLLAREVHGLPEAALKFCLSSELTNTVLVGVNNMQELESAVEAASAELFDEVRLRMSEELGLDDETLVNPSHWPIG